MLYLIYLISIILVISILIYIFTRIQNKDEDNLIEDIPTISINKDELEKYATEIANYYSNTKKKVNCRRKLIKSLDKSYSKILKGYEYIDREARNRKEIVPAAEWMLDNLYLIEKEYKDIKHNMPASYYKNLPVINKGMMKGYPRVYHIAVEIVSHTDGRIDESTIKTFIAAYQKNCILTSGELWAFPIMVRIALIQNIGKIAEKIMFAQDEKKRGDYVADRLINGLEEKRLGEVLKKIQDTNSNFSSHFIERVLKILRDNGIDNPEVYKWIDEKLHEQQTTTDKMISIEHQKQAGFQLSMGNCVTSIREIEALNWREGFEELSYLEQILKQDPSNIYTNMDFESRDNYRHKIEKLSRYMNKGETFVAQKAIECAKEAQLKNSEEYAKHVGYYLIDNGIDCLKKKIGYKDKGIKALNVRIEKYSVDLYILGIIFSTLILISLIIGFSLWRDEKVIWWKYVLATLGIIIPSSEIVISILNWSINYLTTPRFIPKLEFKEGIPEECSAVVIIPTLLNNEKRVHDLVSDMEVYYLANQEKNLYFALLGDFKDSNNEHEDEDKRIIEAALREIKNLNERYCKDKEEIFYFLNRPRKYNEKQGIWLGWERKRGKVMEFNALLRGDNNTSYNVVSGNMKSLQKIKYVITLDADTQLPRDAAKSLIGAMAHVLNKPNIDKHNKKVSRGYGLMQPRISVGTISADKTLFSKIFSGETGIDMYTTAVSDVYQDLFGEGIFTGKGIYDVDTFNYMLKDEIPENTVLSHDLLEGSYVRTALVTDLELIDGYPAYYNSSAIRLHRWVRGDWQLLPWIFKKSPLNKLSRWKLIDNLRRSLLSPSIIILIALSFSLLPRSDKWLIVAILALLCPILFDVSEAVVSPIKGISLSGRIDNGKTAVEQIFLIFCFLPYQTYLMLDAVIRTLYRIFISKKNMLEWMTAADAEVKLGRKLKNFIQSMWIGSIIAIIILALAVNRSINAGLFMLPSCVIWFFSPIIAYAISKERKRIEIQLSDEQKTILRRLSRKTWAYFEDFVNEENNWLAPDNYQEEPNIGVAPRTSPTNMGMGLTSNIVAYDFGYIGLIELVERTEKIISSFEELQRLKGHFYNWYNTKTKEPLQPRYISTVDSGNLVGYLWILSEALNEYARIPFIDSDKCKGLVDSLLLANEEAIKASGVSNFYTNIIDEIKITEFDVLSWKKLLIDIWGKVVELEKIKGCNNLYWNNKIKHTVSKRLRELQKIFPWADIMLETPDSLSFITDKLKKISFRTSFADIEKEIDNIIDEIKIKKLKNKDEKEWTEELKLLLQNGKKEIKKTIEKINNLVERLNNMVTATDFTIVFDKKRQIFAIGYDVEKDSIGNCYYDLLASESRQASFIAIAKCDVDQKHWFKLSRAMTLMDKTKGLVSWSGTMFEYFMPLLIMKSYPDTLLNETYKAVIEGQKKYCRDRRIPWGISESSFYSFDVNLNYQYKAFGIPGIGLKRGLMNELVVSPYSTILALQVDLVGALNNINRLISEGLEGRYGFYEAIDYTKERLPKGKKKAIVKSYMVHHEGMSFMAFDNVLNNNILQERFHRVPKVKATELLLQERVPNRVIYDREQQFELTDINTEKQSLIVRNYNTARTDMPETHLLSNGSYSLMISNSGSGFAKKHDMTIYRWREDVTLDSSGLFFFIKNINSNEFWSAAYEPCKDEGENYEVVFSLDKAEFKRKDGNITTYMEVVVSNEDDAEVRRISITNHSEHTRVIEITSYCEVTLAAYNADLVHPAFSNLFIQTEYIDSLNCIIASRRPRAKNHSKSYIMQTVVVDGDVIGTAQYETSRVNFIGRGRDISNPLAMDNDTALQNTSGAVLDPIISIRRRIKIKSGETCKIAYTMAVADTEDDALELARKYKEINNINRVFELAWTQAQVEMKYFGIKSSQANLYQVMASKILFINTLMKDREKYIKSIKKPQSALWCYGISGDIPIVLLIVRNEKDISLIRQVLNAHEYWSTKGLKADLVIVNLQETTYIEMLQDSIRDIISSSHARDKLNKSGGVFSFNLATMPKEDVELLVAIARLVIDADKGSLIKQINNNNIEDDKSKENIVDEKLSKEKNLNENNKISYELLEESKAFNRNLEFFNELGGFDTENNQYVILLKNYKNTPAPWINVISNGDFGFHVSENGVAYTWNKNSRENKLTTWSNDWISDTFTEGIYLKDEHTESTWSITPKPIRDGGEYIIEHGFGYSNFRHECEGIIGEETMFVPLKQSVKICIVKLRNNTKEKRKLSISYYAQLVLGVVREQTAQYISTYLNRDKNYIYAQNPYSEHFGNMYAYLKILNGEEDTFTGDRKEFIGRGKNIKSPEGVMKKNLANTVGAGYDPCLAANTKITLDPGEESILVILLGQEETIDNIDSIIDEYSEINNVFSELQEVKEYWKKLLGKIKIKTPDRTMDIMLNGWLMYQTLACRVWSRTAFYQSGGAYGFRDQLQDVMAAAYLDPKLTKQQILYSASRQFIEGDVQHWWHPGVNSGIRTRFSDDLLWLPYTVIDYINNTGDYSILDEQTNYLQDEPLKEGEDERYNIVKPSEIYGSIYEHCIKTIEISLRFGNHNIPLMGSGDWNDGMSTIGNKGKGESVWLGWFLYSILDNFKYICRYKGEEDKYKKYEEYQKFIQENLELNAWDGSWYRRAYFDDGTPLGSAENDECQIDSLSQSWSVISNAAKESRAKEAMQAMENYLVKEESGIVLLLTPPFNKSKLEPGYIKGYVSGVRENGGQYTHASTWVVLALTKLGYGDKAWKIYNMLNPINHAKSIYECERYKVEPYVMCADVYATEPFVGRGGWSWYTGAAGWMYRVGIDGILGLKLKEGKGFSIEPCIPEDWEGYEIEYEEGKAKYNIIVKRGDNKGINVDGNKLDDKVIPFMEEGIHNVEVII